MDTPQETFVLPPNFGWLPRNMIALSVIAYHPKHLISGQVAGYGWDVVWGPFEKLNWDGIPVCLAYIAQLRGTNDYVVVIRGTEVISLVSWLEQDFALAGVDFRTLVPGAPQGTLISQGTLNGVNDLLSLPVGANQGPGMVEFLKSRPAGYSVYVTGHSLGGTLTPPLFACLNAALNGGGVTRNMLPMSFAGLTPGNGTFNDYFVYLFATRFKPVFPWRFHNMLDIAPFLWWSLPDVQNIYASLKPRGIQWQQPEEGFLRKKFAEAAPYQYVQPKGGYALPGTPTGSTSWVAQAADQHHGTTYQRMIDVAFPAADTPVTLKQVMQPQAESAAGPA